MAINFACPGCEKKYKVDEKLAGKKVRCKDCGATMPVPASVAEEDEFANLTGDEEDESEQPAPLPPPPRVAKTGRPPAKRKADADTPARKTRPRRASDGEGSRFPIYLIAGLFGGAIGAAIWGGIVYLSDREIGWIAWGLGGLVGFCVRVAADDRGDGFLPGVTAAGISVLSIVAGKYLAAALLVSKLLNNVPAPPGVAQGELRWLAFKTLFGAVDVVFFLLAIATAFRLGSGESDD